MKIILKLWQQFKYCNINLITIANIYAKEDASLRSTNEQSHQNFLLARNL